MYFTGYIIANFILCAVIGVLIGRTKLNEFRVLLGFVLAALFSNTMEIASVDFYLKLFFNQLKFVGVVFISPATLFLYLKFLNLDRFTTFFVKRIVYTLPIIVLFFVVTNPLHHLFYTVARIEESNLLTFIEFEPSIVFWINSAYSYVIILGAVVLLFIGCFKKPEIYRGQNYVIIGTALIAITLNIIVVLGVTKELGDFSIVSFAIAALFQYWGIYLYKPTKMIRLARSIAVNEINNPVFIFDDNGVVLDANINAIKSFQLDKNFESEFTECLRNFTEGEIIYNRQIFSVTEKRLYNSRNVYFGRALVLTDITKMKESVEQLEFALSHDVLTGLSTRDYFKNNFTKLKEENLPLSIIYFNICAMKVINNALGYQFGDMVIQFVANTILEEIKDKGVVGRMNGDEFAVVLYNSDENKAREIAEKINNVCMETNYNNIFVGLYSGVVSIKDKSRSFEIELKNAIGETYRHKLLSSTQYYLKVFYSFESVLKKESYSKKGSIERVKNLCREYAEYTKMPTEQRERLSLLSSTHNIGLLNTSEKIVEKIGSFSNEEWEDYKLHTVRGYNIALTSQALFTIANDILHHHERYDGLGYPHMLKGEEIPYLSRVLAVIIYYDKLVTKGQEHDAVMAEIRWLSGKMFDPKIVDKFLSFREDYNGTVGIERNKGEISLVF